MVALHRSRVIQVLRLGFEERLSATVDVLRSLDTFPTPSDLELLDTLVAEDPQRTINAIVDLLAGEDEPGFKPWLMWLEQAKLLSLLERTTGPQPVIDAVLHRVDQEQWPGLIDHLDLSPTEPDPLLIALLDRSDEPSLRGRALFRFMYPETAYTGPESFHLRERRRVAEQWIEASPTRGRYRTWLDELNQTVDRRIESVEVEEAERGY
jgi:hypothetical protein